MATAADCIKLALRKLRVVGQGQNPSSAQQADALVELNHMLREWAENGASYPIINRRISASYQVESGYPAIRLQCEVGGLTITLPEGANSFPVPDGMRVAIVDVGGNFAASPATLARNGWKIAGTAGNVTLNTASLSRTYMFRADLGDWRQVTDLSVSDSLPFPTEFDYGIALMLARRLEGEYGQPLGPNDARAASRARINLYARYVKPGSVAFDPAVSRIGGRPPDYAYSHDAEDTVG